MSWRPAMSSPNEQITTPGAAATSPVFQCWQQGYGVIRHSETTASQVQALAQKLVAAGLQPDADSVYRKLIALDRLASAGLWLVVHMSYCNRVDIAGAPLEPKDFKTSPEGQDRKSTRLNFSHVRISYA